MSLSFADAPTPRVSVSLARDEELRTVLEVCGVTDVS